VLETESETDNASLCLIDFMPLRSERPDIVRIVEGGSVEMGMDLRFRFNYGSLVPSPGMAFPEPRWPPAIAAGQSL